MLQENKFCSEPSSLPVEGLYLIQENLLSGEDLQQNRCVAH